MALKKSLESRYPVIQTDFDSNFYEDSKSVFIFQIQAFSIEILKDKVEALVRESFLKRETLVLRTIFL